MTTDPHPDATESTFAPAGLSKAAAEKSIDLLQAQLTDLLDLSMSLKHAHWNVVGPGFMAVHELLDRLVDETRVHLDAVAERIATLGGIPNGLPGHIVETRQSGDYALGRGVTSAHLAAIDQVYSRVVEGHRSAIDAADDVVTEDLLTGQAGELEQQQWFVRAHIENTSGRLPSGEDQLGVAAAAALADPLE